MTSCYYQLLCSSRSLFKAPHDGNLQEYLQNIMYLVHLISLKNICIFLQTTKKCFYKDIVQLKNMSNTLYYICFLTCPSLKECDYFSAICNSFISEKEVGKSCLKARNPAYWSYPLLAQLP